MNDEKKYLLSSKLSSSTFQARAIGLSNKEDGSRLFDEHKLILGEYAGISFPVVFRHEYGKNLQDMLDTGWASLFLISGKMKAVLEANRFSGWKTFDVKVIDKYEHEIPGYYGLSISGRSGKIDYSKSEIINKQLVPNGSIVRYYKGMHLGMDKWDGSDFFLPENYFGIIVTQKVVQVFKEEQITNVRLRNIMEMEVDFFSV